MRDFCFQVLILVYFYLFMHQIKRDSEPHLGSGKCILKNLIRKEILMYYRPFLYLRHFQNDKSQRPFSPSFFLLFCPLPPHLLSPGFQL